MSKLHKSSTGRVTAKDVLDQISNIYSNHRGDLITEEASTQVATLESLQDTEFAQCQSSFSTINNKLKEAELERLVYAQMGVDPNEADHYSRHIADVAMESATMTLMAMGDPSKYQKAYLNTKGRAPSDAIAVDMALPGVFADDVTMESFVVSDYSQFAAMSVMVSALSLAEGGMSQLFFPSEVVPAGNSGKLVTLSIPYVYNRTKRAANGAPFEFEKKPLIHAIEDHTILQGSYLDIVPYGDAAANNDAFLVDAAVIPNWPKMVGGIEVNTRPIKFGVKTNLLSLSNHPGLLNGDVQDETDALDPNINLGEVWVSITADVGGTPTTQIHKFDLSGLQSSNFTMPTEGKGGDLTVNFNSRVVLNQNAKSINASDLNDLELYTPMGVTATDDYAFELNMTLSGSAHSERGDFVVFANDISVGTGYTGNDKITTTQQAALEAKITAVELLGIYPDARRINANLRMKGIFIDNSETNRYFYGIKVGSPICAVHPLAGNGSGASVEGLVQASKTRTSNLAITALLAGVERIKNMEASGAIYENATTIGTNFVRPKYMYREVDVRKEIEVERSQDTRNDMRAFLVDEITTIAEYLAQESSYLSALTSFLASDREFEVIVGGDPRIINYLMISGDDRTLGERLNFRFDSSLDKRMRGRLFISFRRKNHDGLDPLSSGGHLTMPALVHEVSNSSRGGATVREVQVQPREAHVVTLPIMGELVVKNIDEFHKRDFEIIPT